MRSTLPFRSKSCPAVTGRITSKPPPVQGPAKGEAPSTRSRRWRPAHLPLQVSRAVLPRSGRDGGPRRAPAHCPAGERNPLRRPAGGAGAKRGRSGERADPAPACQPLAPPPGRAGSGELSPRPGARGGKEQPPPAAVTRPHAPTAAEKRLPSPSAGPAPG